MFAFASRAGAAWGQLPETALSLEQWHPASRRELARAAGAPKNAPRLSFRCAPGPWGTPEPTRVPQSASGSGTGPRSRPGWLRPARKVASAAGRCGGGGVPEGGGRCSSAQSDRVWPRDRTVCDSGSSRLPLARLVSEPRRVASANRCRWLRLPTRAPSPGDSPPGALTALAPRNVAPARPHALQQ